MLSLLAWCVAPLLGRETAEPLFVDVTERALAGVRTTCGSPDKAWIVEVNGGGVALGDFDGDGAADLVVVDGSTLERVAEGRPGLPPRLFLNDGRGSFRPAPEAWAMAGGRWGMGCATGDVDGDGWLDLLVTEWGRDRLFRNDSGRGFVEITEGSGLTGERWGTSAAFLDYDADGHLDLVVANYLAFVPGEVGGRGTAGCDWKGHDVLCGPEGLVPVHDQLYRGKGDGTFEDVSVAAGFHPDRAAFGLGVMTLDFDQDGDTDVYVANDSTPNHLWENLGDGTFREVGLRRGVAYDEDGREQAGMGIGCGDWNGDGRPDLFVTNFSGEANALYASSGRGFRDRATRSGAFGPSLARLGWGTGLVDLDLDGDLDAFTLNGHVYPQADLPGTDTSYAQPDELLRNDGSGRFGPERLYAGPDVVSRAGAVADLDGDGDPDIVALSVEGPVRVLENRAAGGHWLCVRLRDPAGNGQGLGARVELAFGEDEPALATRSAEVRTAGGFQAALPAEVCFGLGAHTRVAAVLVRWPDGTEQRVEGTAVDRVIVVERER